MSTQILNFKKIEITAESKEVAIAQMEESYFHYNGDATQAFKNWKAKQTKGITERDTKEFMLDYLAKKTKNAPGTGFMITVESAVGDTRERPYKIEDVKNEEGKRKFKKFYVWIDEETGKEVCKVGTNKADAKNALKELYKTGEYKGDAKLKLVHEVTEGQAIVATAKYTPSKNTKNGSYICFGIEA